MRLYLHQNGVALAAGALDSFPYRRSYQLRRRGRGESPVELAERPPRRAADYRPLHFYASSVHNYLHQCIRKKPL